MHQCEQARAGGSWSEEERVSRRAKIIIAIVVVVVIAGVAISFAMKSQGSGPAIQTATVGQTDLGVTVSASGKIEAGSRADVYPPAAGTISAVYVSDGESVTAGQKLAKMETAPLKLAVKQARAALSQAQSAYDNLDAQTVSSADIAAARANVRATRSAYHTAKKNADAVNDQVPTKDQLNAAKAAEDAAHMSYVNASHAYAAALSAYPSSSPTIALAAAAKQQAYAGYLSAKSTYNSLRATNLETAHTTAQTGVKQAYAAYKGALASLYKAEAADPASQRNAASAAVDQADQALSIAENNLANATLVAPIDGTLFFNDAGAAGADGKTPVAASGSAVSLASAPFSVVDLAGSTFSAEVDEADVDRVRVGMGADVTLDSFPGETFKTKVTHIDSAAQPTATGGTIFPVSLAIKDTGKNVLIGMKGDATIKVSSIPNALTIPLEALFNENGTNFVYKVEGGTKLAKTTIAVGATTDTQVEVVSGLNKGDQVALASPTTYTDGMTVRVKN
jgi:HlyD family secretion protein